MDTFDAITSRRQVRSYTDRTVPDEALNQILEAGRRAPSGKNEQRWDFVVVRDRTDLRRLAGVWQGAGWIPSAAAVVAVVVPTSDDEHTRLMIRFDAGQAAMQMMIAASGIDVACGQAACSDQALAADILGFPHGYECISLITLGYPADRPLKPIVNPARRAFDEVVHFDRW